MESPQSRRRGLRGPGQTALCFTLISFLHLSRWVTKNKLLFTTFWWDAWVGVKADLVACCGWGPGIPGRGGRFLWRGNVLCLGTVGKQAGGGSFFYSLCETSGFQTGEWNSPSCVCWREKKGSKVSLHHNLFYVAVNNHVWSNRNQ